VFVDWECRLSVIPRGEATRNLARSKKAEAGTCARSLPYFGALVFHSQRRCYRDDD